MGPKTFAIVIRPRTRYHPQIGLRIDLRGCEMRIQQRNKVIFVHVPRTGGTSVELAMDQWPNQDHVRAKLRKHETAAQIRKWLGADKFDDCLRVSIVRNPWDQMVSCFHWWQQKAPHFSTSRNVAKFVDGLTFEVFMQSQLGMRLNEFPMSTMDWLTDRRGNLLVDFICRTETLNDDYLGLCSKLRDGGLEIPETGLPVANATERSKDYRSYYDEHSKQLVSERFARVIKQFGYRF